ncbi:MAG: acyl-CoA desaturase [Acidobacteriota bacterium]|nr:acyl-CoA desaturase [Blastocatellia bacterium]MDW8412780.1 acyl-CoA desaturase [Acidobacteriota bacterium]
MVIICFFVVHWFSSLFFQTFFLHRYAAHRMFKMSKFWERTFYLLTFIFQGSSFLNARSYAIMHRMHHAYSDTDKDPHTPVTGGLVAMVLSMLKVYHGILVGNIVPEKRFTENIAEWPLLEKVADSWLVRIGWGALYTLFYFYFATDWWMYLLLPMHYVMGPIHGTIVNYCGHKIGYRNFARSRDNSRNTLFWDVLLLGELFQNNHHTYPNRVNFAVRWFEFDPVYPLIRLMAFLGIVALAEQKK